MSERIGFGYDVHPLVVGRPLVLGGVTIPFEKGLAGHSDADVLTHALIDAMLGASGKGSIGEHFSDQDAQYKGIASLVLLKKTMEMCREAGMEVIHVDGTVLCEAPLLSPYFPKMKEILAPVLGISDDRLNLKAKRNEGLGFVGRGEGMAAYVVCLLGKMSGG